MTSARYVLAIDQGTTSTRAMLFDRAGSVVAASRREHRQNLPKAGWVEHDPAEIWGNVRDVIGQALARAGCGPGDVAAVGIANQRETTLAWDRRTGRPVHPAIVWQDTRTRRIVDALARDGGPGRFADRVGLPLATYFSGPKIAWILDNVAGARLAAEDGDLAFGTVDTWLLWQLTGGPGRGIHATDVTNASRTMLLDLRTLDWDPAMAAALHVPMSLLPEVRSSSEVYALGADDGPLPGVPIAGVLGDQQAATFGQACFTPGSAKNTYGTGSFLLLNTGERAVRSEHGLLTTVCYRIGDRPAVYALEGSIAETGGLVTWLRDNLGIIERPADVERLAREVPDNGGAYFVPAFSGLFAPHWRADARGALLGLTRFVTRAHVARAALEAAAFQTREVVDAMEADSGVRLTELRVDGGMAANDLLLQLQADLLDVDVVRPTVRETTALGAAHAAGIAVGFWAGERDVVANWTEDRRWHPRMRPADRDRLYGGWRKAVARTFDWVDDDA